MPEPENPSCHCPSCGTRVVFPPELASTTTPCPACQANLTLDAEEFTVFEPGDAEANGAACTTDEVSAAFSGTWEGRRASTPYVAGLAVVTLAMVLLPLLYLGLIFLTGWLIWVWAHLGLALFDLGGTHQFRGGLIQAVIYLAPLFAGLVLLVFLIKPLFARRVAGAQPLALNPASEPVLFALIARVCQAVGAPFPERIDLNCSLNAAAGFRRGLRSLFSNDLVLTIGLPLAAGLTATQLAGVVAHEFGHFRQGIGLRLSYVIRAINGWFARAVYERDSWDELLEEWSESDLWFMTVLVIACRVAIGLTRLVLHGLMLAGHAIAGFMLRQMEYDADRCQLQLAGSDAFEATFRRIHVLEAILDPAYKSMRMTWNLNRHLPENFPAHLLAHDDALSESKRTRLEDTLGLEPTGTFDAHPSNGDRIRRARQLAAPGIFRLDRPASDLFTNFPAIARQITLVHYADDLGLPLELVKLIPVKPAAAPGAEASPDVSAPAPPESETASDPGRALTPPRLRLRR